MSWVEVGGEKYVLYSWWKTDINFHAYSEDNSLIKSTAQKPSHSRLSALYTCERKYYYKYELELEAKDRSFAPMIAGKAGHAALDAHFKDEDWRDALHTAWGDHIFRGDYDWLTADFIEAVVEQYIDARHPLGISAADSGIVIESELEGLVEISLGVELVVKIDLVTQLDNGDLRIVDHKFTTGYLGVGQYADLAYGYQLCIYSMAAEKILGKEVRRAAGNAIWMGKQAILPSSKTRKKGYTTAQKWQWIEDDLRFRFDDDRRAETILWIKEGISRMNHRIPVENGLDPIDDWPKSPSRNCNTCEFNELCSRQGQARNIYQKLHYRGKRYE